MNAIAVIHKGSQKAMLYLGWAFVQNKHTILTLHDFHSGKRQRNPFLSYSGWERSRCSQAG